jgi:hypothetical protein
VREVWNCGFEFCALVGHIHAWYCYLVSTCGNEGEKHGSLLDSEASAITNSIIRSPDRGFGKGSPPGRGTTNVRVVRPWTPNDRGLLLM